MSQPFPNGTLVTRKPQHYNDWWRSWCRRYKLPLDSVFIINGWEVCHDNLEGKMAAGPDLSLFCQYIDPTQTLEDFA